MNPGTRVRPSRVPPGWPAAVGTVLHPSLWARLLRLLHRTPRTHGTLVKWDADVTPVWCDPTELRAVADQPSSRAR